MVEEIEIIENGNKIPTIYLKNQSHNVLIEKKKTRFRFLNRFNNSQLSIKLLWLCCFLLSSALCSFMVFKSLKDYLSFDVVTKVRIIDANPSIFPTITICNIDQHATENSSELIRNIILREFDTDITNKNITSKNYMDYIEIAHAISLSEAYNPKFGDDKRKALGFKLNEVLYKCVYNKNPCTVSDFSWHYNFHYSNCFQFNSGLNSKNKYVAPKYTSIPGENNGLYMVFFLPISKNKYSAAHSNGLRIFVHNRSFTPLTSEGINVKSSTLTSIALKRTFTYKYPAPYSDCYDLSQFDSVLYSNFKQNNRTYRQSDCFDMCLQMNIIENCDCYYLNYPNLFDANPCLNTTQLLCAFEQYIKFIDENIKKKCESKCPLECNSVTFDFFLSHSDFPTRSYYEIYKRDKSFINKYFNKKENFTFDEIRQRAIAVNIYYPQLKYTEITELKKTSLIDLFSNIGGTIGLFLGMSFMSLIRSLIRHSCSKRSKNKARMNRNLSNHRVLKNV